MDIRSIGRRADRTIGQTGKGPIDRRDNWAKGEARSADRPIDQLARRFDGHIGRLDQRPIGHRAEGPVARRANGLIGRMVQWAVRPVGQIAQYASGHWA